MSKKELVEQVSAHVKNVDKKTVGAVLEGLGEAAQSALRTGGEVKLPGIGKLIVTTRAARHGRNPRTGAAVPIPASKAVKFKPGVALKSVICATA
jgi:DNA-binding protein HU-beta